MSRLVRCAFCEKKSPDGECCRVIDSQGKAIYMHDACAIATLRFAREQIRRARIRNAARAKVKG